MRLKRSDSTTTSSKPIAPPESEETSPAPDLEAEETNRTPEENKNPSKILGKSDKLNEISRRSTSSFTPPPALSPAYPLGEKMEEEEEEEAEVKMEVESDSEEKSPKKPEQPGCSSQKSTKIESKTLEINGKTVLKREKMKYKFQKRQEKEKDAVPFLDPNAPKRNRSAYVHFIIHRRASYSKAVMTQRDINIALAADWQKLTSEERVPFQKKAEEEKEKFLELMEEYKKTDSHKEFQKKRLHFLSQKDEAKKDRKRKRNGQSDSDEEGSSTLQMSFPGTNVFCPLLNPSEPTSSSSSLQYSGPIFTPEFVTYNKTRDTYRRQLAIERSNVEHELEALHHHDMENRIKRQEDRIRSVDEKSAETLDKLKSVFGGIVAAKDHLTSVESLTEWLESMARLGARDVTRKAVKEAINKHGKSIIAMRK